MINDNDVMSLSMGDPEHIDEQTYDFEVTTPSGAVLPVLTEDEIGYYVDRAKRYTTDHKFSSITDLQDLDRILSTELMLHRYDIWLTLTTDYWGNSILEKDFLKYSKELSETLSKLKKSMGLDKVTRDKDQGADFVTWLENTKARAKQFMVMRNEQFYASITLFHEMIGQLQLHKNADSIERKELGLEPEQVIEWLWNDLIPRFKEIDEHFRNAGPDAQKYWIGGL